MRNNTIHFVINEDQKDDKLGSFNARITRLGPAWTIPRDIDALLQCISVLDKDHLITIWVHLGAQEPNDSDLYDGNVWVQDIFSKKFAETITRRIRFISRPNFRREHLPIQLGTGMVYIPVIKITEVSNAFSDKNKFISISELELTDSKSHYLEDDSILSLSIPADHPFLTDFLQANKIDEINQWLSSAKKCWLLAADQQGIFWHEALMNLIGFTGPNPFLNKFWEFKKDVFTRFFVLSPHDVNYAETLSKDFSSFEADVKFNTNSKQWEIKLNFFYALFERKRTDDFDWHDYTQVASTLYVLHEALHQEHKLDYRTVEGIGNFPKTVEDADYQADAFAIIVEFCRYYYENTGKLTSKLLREKIVRLIRIAIETTFSFNPLRELSGIQVRRVNRYLIWFYQICLIETKVKNDISDSEALAEILNILSIKPVIEIKGPALYVNKAKDRILYDLNNYNKHGEELVLFEKNVIRRFGKTGNFELAKLIQGLKSSNFKLAYEWISTVIWSNNK